MTGKFQHMELSTDDVEGAKRFYGSLFGWKFKEFPMPEGAVYNMVHAPDGAGVGGITPKMMPGQPTAWLGYITVDSADKTIAKAKQLGANVIMDRMEIPNMGIFAIFADPTGGAFAIWESLSPPPPPAKAAKKKAAKKKKAPAKKAAKKAPAANKAAAKKAPAKKAAKKKR
jgi:predicted enzyme related to lactoylglutathione lyase